MRVSPSWWASGAAPAVFSAAGPGLAHPASATAAITPRAPIARRLRGRDMDRLSFFWVGARNARRRPESSRAQPTCCTNQGSRSVKVRVDGAVAVVDLVHDAGRRIDHVGVPGVDEAAARGRAGRGSATDAASSGSVRANTAPSAAEHPHATVGIDHDRATVVVTERGGLQQRHIGGAAASTAAVARPAATPPARPRLRRGRGGRRGRRGCSSGGGVHGVRDGLGGDGAADLAGEEHGPLGAGEDGADAGEVGVRGVGARDCRARDAVAGGVEQLDRGTGGRYEQVLGEERHGAGGVGSHVRGDFEPLAEVRRGRAGPVLRPRRRRSPAAPRRRP